MLKELEYPFHGNEIISKRKNLRKQLLSNPSGMIPKKIAILGGFTTHNVRIALDLFLLNYGIQAEFYESEYNQYYEDGMFPNPELESFQPDIIYLCTCNKNVIDYPQVSDEPSDISKKFQTIWEKFSGLWQHLSETYHCTMIQNNFDYPSYRLLGNRDASDLHGRVNFITRLNCKFYEYAQTHEEFFICDLNYISSCYGLDQWYDSSAWHMYKYPMAVPAIPYLSFQVANIMKSVYGKNKKALCLDLDNTLWGGVIGEDGPGGIEIGQETAQGQVYAEFQSYLKEQKNLGVLLTVNSKNDEANALAGFECPGSVLKQEDFVRIQANWNPKSENLKTIAEQLNLLPESFVFVDDNPAEREIIRQAFPETAVPEMVQVETYLKTLDRSGYFEATHLSADDQKRNAMYQENAARSRFQAAFTDYQEYLRSLEMRGTIKPFEPVYLSRIAQLTNKSNQFNLTTKRYSQSEVEAALDDTDLITLYGKLEDKFGDNGVVSVVIGRIAGEDRSELHMELWLMSCRVLKRDMEFAMMDALVEKARELGIRKIMGYYYPSAKNGMVKDFYGIQGFRKISQDEQGNTVWEFEIPEEYQKKQRVITVNG